MIINQIQKFFQQFGLKEANYGIDLEKKQKDKFNLLNSISNPETYQFSTLNWNFPKKDHQFSVLNWLVKKKANQFSGLNSKCFFLVNQFSVLNWYSKKAILEFSGLNWLVFLGFIFPYRSQEFFVFFGAKLLIRIRSQEHYSSIAPCMGHRLHVLPDIPSLHMGAVVHQLLPLLLLRGSTHGWLGSSSYSSSSALRLSLQS